MRAQIAFQACWNGVDLYKSDNSHVDYMSQIINGVCSPEYPFQLPNLFMETDYAPEQVPDQTDDGVWVFSQGDTTGYGFHGDFINGEHAYGYNPAHLSETNADLCALCF